MVDFYKEVEVALATAALVGWSESSDCPREPAMHPSGSGRWNNAIHCYREATSGFCPTRRYVETDYSLL